MFMNWSSGLPVMPIHLVLRFQRSAMPPAFTTFHWTAAYLAPSRLFKT
jgi:hypothetical protein